MQNSYTLSAKQLGTPSSTNTLFLSITLYVTLIHTFCHTFRYPLFHTESLSFSHSLYNIHTHFLPHIQVPPLPHKLSLSLSPTHTFSLCYVCVSLLPHEGVSVLGSALTKLFSTFLIQLEKLGIICQAERTTTATATATATHTFTQYTKLSFPRLSTEKLTPLRKSRSDQIETI